MNKLISIFKGKRKSDESPDEERKAGEEDPPPAIAQTNCIETKREAELDAMLHEQLIDLTELKKLSWFGLAKRKPKVRAKVWKILLEYYPVNQEMWDESLSRKRSEYLELATEHFQDLTYKEEKAE